MRVVGWVAFWAARGLTWLLATFFWRVRIEGKENIPETGGFLLCPNHRSNVDGPLTCVVTRRRMRYLAKESMFNIEWLGKVYKAMGAIEVNRGAPDRASLHACLEVLKAGRGLVLFPEGTRQVGNEITEIHEGAAYLALRTGAPIVPVGFGHSARAHRKGEFFLRPVRITCVIGTPLVFNKGDSNRVTRAAITEATESIKAHLQALFDESEGRPVTAQS